MIHIGPSLINIDAKILAKLIANRIRPFMTALVLPDQSGFVPSRGTSHNLRTLFAVLQDIDPDANAVAVFLDATKACDSLEWDYLAFVLRRMGFPEPFLAWIHLLYIDLQASTLVNGAHSSPFAIARGTRQGCPLSPLLFALVIEPLATKIRQHYRDRALRYPERQILIPLCADDLTLYLCDPEDSLNPILRLLTLFGRLSGVNMNWGKSQIFPPTDTTPPFTPDYPLKWCDDTVTYLGITITCNRKDLMTANYGCTLTLTTDKIIKWIAMPISMAGRASLIKMVILPKLLYLFINIPYAPSKHFFQALKLQLICLTWWGKQPRIPWNILTRPFNAGGFEIPNLEL